MYSLGLASSLRKRAVNIVTEPATQMGGEGTDTARARTFSREEKEGTAAKHRSEVRGIMQFQPFL